VRRHKPTHAKVCILSYQTGFAMTPDIMLVLAVLGVTVFLFVTELLRVDVIAILIMLTLGWLGLVTPEQAFSGLASNAVVSIIAVIILGYGVDRAGVMRHVTKPILRLAGNSESRLIALVSGAVGGISAFLQNVGAAALFLPALTRIARRTGIPASRLMMPMGFAAILGGTLTMVGSSPLIVLNDLMKQGKLESFGLFSPAPAGLALLGAGILYFMFFGRWVLPARNAADSDNAHQDTLIAAWNLPTTLLEMSVPPDSALIGKTREQVNIESDYQLHLLSLQDGADVVHAPWRQTEFAAGQTLLLLGEPAAAHRLASDWGLTLKPVVERFEDMQNPGSAGYAEILVTPRAALSGASVRDIGFRRRYQVEPMLLLSGGQAHRYNFSDHPLNTGDALVVHGRWDKIEALCHDENFVSVAPIEAEKVDASKAWYAIACFAGAIILALSGVQLALALMSGALAMILLRVINIDEAYQSVDWRTVFLLAGLIPLGLAMDKTGAAAWVAGELMTVLQGSHVLVILLAVAVLTTLFSLFMSNVAATVLLVPLVLDLGLLAGIDPRALALLVGLTASNSFLLPTHQVNALLMVPGGYRNADYLRAGGIMTLIFISIAVGFIYFVYL
jgi:di/tricarboxylate transporter